MSDYLALLENSRIVHALTGHAPVALTVLGLLFVLAGAATKMKSPAVRGTTFVIYALLAGAAYGASLTGPMAADDMPKPAKAEMNQLLETHQWAAQYAWIPAAATAVLVLLCFAQGARGTFAALALLGGLVTVGGVGLVAVTGTQLVYEHGAGLPDGASPVQSASEKEDSSAKPVGATPAPFGNGLPLKINLPGAASQGAAPTSPSTPPPAPSNPEAAEPGELPPLPPAETVKDNL